MNSPELGDQHRALLALSGLDVNAGLASVGGKLATYRRLLGMLVDQHAGDLVLIRTALAGGQREEARRLAHSLKGAAATLGAEPLRVAALAAEMAAKSDPGAAVMEACLSELETRLNELLAGLHSYFSAHPAVSAVAPGANDPDARNLLQQLCAALEVDDLQANTLWLDNAARFEPMLASHAPAIGKAIEHYDFALALKLLRAAMNT